MLEISKIILLKLLKASRCALTTLKGGLVMLKPATQKMLIECARKYGVKALWLFGSSLTVDEDDAMDIDLGVEGIDRDMAWEMYSELFDLVYAHCNKIIDFVAMDEPLSIVHVIRSKGIRIYDAAS